MAQMYGWNHERHGALPKGRSGAEKEASSHSIHLCVEIEADVIDTGLFVHLAQQLHQVMSFKS